MANRANPTNLGKKINISHVVWQVTKLIHEGISDRQVSHIMRDRYAFKVSVPNIASFRANFYQKRLEELKRDSADFQEKQTGRIKSFIDESLSQARAIKDDINSMNRQLRVLDKEMEFASRFDTIFQNAFDNYVQSYNPDNPKRFLESAASEEERNLKKIVDTMMATGDPGFDVLSTYCQARAPHPLMRLIAFLRSKVLDQRSSLVKIHKDIFKGYKNFSIMQELTMVFEKYNGLIIEEFFPDRKTMDKAKYFRVRKKILALFDELQIRYQGVESPTSDHQEIPSQKEAEEVVSRVEDNPEIIDAQAKETEKPKSRMGGRPLSKSRQAKIDKEAEEKANKQSLIDVDTETLTEEEAQTIMEEAEAQAKAREKAGAMDNLFGSIIGGVDKGQDILTDLDVKAGEKHGEDPDKPLPLKEESGEV